MFLFFPTTLDIVMRKYDYTSIFESLRINEMGVEEIFAFLQRNMLMRVATVDGEFCGFFSLEDCEEGEIEVHAFIVPEHRNKTKEILEGFAEAIFILTPFTSIRTIITGDHQPLVRFLRMIGFETVEVLPNSVKKESGTYDATILKLKKGE